MDARIGIATAVLLAVVAAPLEARAERVDPWFGRDKAYHFAASAGISATGYAFGAALLFDARGHALILGGALSLAAGAGKELLDLTGFGDPSWRDFTWDCIGNVTGLALAWSADLVIRGVSEKHPLLVAPRISHDGAGAQIFFAF